MEGKEELHNGNGRETDKWPQGGTVDRINVGQLGIGTVGFGVIGVLGRNGDEIARRTGSEIVIISALTRSLLKRRHSPPESIRLTEDALSVVTDPNIDIVCELIGGIEPARTLILTAIDNGKHVVTANKALIALHGNEIFAAAHAKGVIVAFEAAVAGGIPIIKIIREGLAANRINTVAGIINGTTNYILTAMGKQGREFEDVLAEAQELGYAEADPLFDIEGIDSAHKLAILAAIAFGIPLAFDKIYIEGIRHITPADIHYAEKLGYSIKHLAVARNTDEGIELRVHPALIPKWQLLANVNDEKNAVLVNGDAVGSTFYYGAGAGAEPTASAVVTDLIDVARAMGSHPAQRVPSLAFQPGTLSHGEIKVMDDIETACYLRLRVLDQADLLTGIRGILDNLDISIEAINHKQVVDGVSYASIILLTRPVREKNMNEAISRIEKLNNVDGSVQRIRLETAL